MPGRLWRTPSPSRFRLSLTASTAEMRNRWRCPGLQGEMQASCSEDRSRKLLYPYTPGISHQYQNKGLIKFDCRKSLIPKDATSVACNAMGSWKKKSGSRGCRFLTILPAMIVMEKVEQVKGKVSLEFFRIGRRPIQWPVPLPQEVTESSFREQGAHGSSRKSRVET